MAKFINSVQTYMKVDEATSTKDDVTPVYLLDEVYELARSGQDVQGLVDHLIKRLGHRSPVVKFKTLRVIKYVAQKNCSEFKRLFSRHAAAIRELTHFKGEQDAFKGDVPNQRVRDMAKQTLDALFAVQEAPSYHQTANPLKDRIQGFGSGGPAETGGYQPETNNSSSKYIGFGNPRMPQPTPAPTTFDVAKQWLSSVGLTQPKRPSSKSMLEEDDHYSYRDNGVGNTYSNSNSYSSYTAPASYAAPASPAQVTFRPAAPVVSDGSDELRLVEKICQPGGLRPQPDKDDLRDFVEGVSVVKGSKVATHLDEKLTGTSWQSALRALCAIEAAVKQGTSPSCAEIVQHFQDNPIAVKQAARSTQASVRLRALKVLELLGASAPSRTSSLNNSNSVPKPAARAQPEASLLDFGDEPSATSVTSNGNAADLLGELLGGGEPAAAPANGNPQANGNGLFSGLDVQGSKSQHVNGGMENDLFGGLSVAGNAAAPAPSAASATSLADALSELHVASTTSAPAQNGMSSSNSLSDLLNTLPSSNSVPNGSMFGASPVSNSMQMSPQMQMPPIMQQMPQAGHMQQMPQAGHMQQMPQAGHMQQMPQAGHMQQMPQGVHMGQTPQMGMQPQMQMGMMPGGMAVPIMHMGGMTNGMQMGMLPQMGGMPQAQMQMGMMPQMGMNPMMQMGQMGMMPQMGFGLVGQQTAAGGGPIPLEAFHTATPTPHIEPKNENDKAFEFIGDVLSTKKKY